MSKLPNIMQRRELDPLLHKADRIAKHYEKVANCPVSVIRPEISGSSRDLISICRYCKGEVDEFGNKVCALMHINAVKKAKEGGGTCIYACKENYVFWTSTFYSGKQYAGALLSGGIHNKKDNTEKVKALANMMLMCTDQISEESFAQKNIAASLVINKKGNYAESTEENAETPFQGTSNQAFIMDLERMLIANLRRGDITEARGLLFKLLNARYREVKASFPAFRLRALELLVLLSRATTNPDDINDKAILEANSRYQKKINESGSFTEIGSILLEVAEKMAERIFSFHGVKHYPALRKAERYIWNNYTRKISLTEIASASGLSAPYFSTIFKEEMGENLSEYLNRLRIEKAASLLITTNMSVGEISKSCGFEDQSWFSKIFKINTGFSPGKYREQGNIPSSTLGLSA